MTTGIKVDSEACWFDLVSPMTADLSDEAQLSSRIYQMNDALVQQGNA
jgi:hypothetical protein